MRLYVRVAGAVTTMVVSGGALGQATFTLYGGIQGGQWIGVESVADDGSAVVGTANFPTPGGGTMGRAFRWSAATGIVNLGTLPSSLPLPYSDAYDVSGDGSVVVGRTYTTSNRAFRWSNGAMVELPLLAGGSSSSATSVSADGATIIGNCTVGGSPHIVRWTAAGAEDLGAPSFGTWSVAWGSSADGSVIAGYAYTNFNQDERGFVLDQSGFTNIGVPAGHLRSRALAVSDDGSVIAGHLYGASPSPPTPFRWTRSGGLEPLALLPGASGAIVADISGDGSVIVGSVQDGSPDPDGYVWTRWQGMRSIREVLQSYGLPVLGVPGIVPRSVSASGRTIAGYAGLPNQYQLWMATLPPGFGCYANCNGSTASPTINVEDFACFLQRFAAGDPVANCDQSTSVPALNVADFTCFLRQFAAGCQ